MKHIFVFLFIITSALGLHAQNVSEQASKAYQDEDYRKAIELLEGEIKQLKQQGKVSPELYYNLGNAYFRANEVPQALLYYERALLYNPSDKDLKHNIDFAQTKIEDKILKADNFFLQIWFDNIQNLTTSNKWAGLSIVFFVIFVGALVLFFFRSKVNIKKIGFYTSLISLIFVIFMNIFSFRQREKIENRNTAIIMAGSVPVVSAPASKSKELFIIHSGTKVDILKSDGNWYEIEIANGNVGWIEKNKLEII